MSTAAIAKTLAAIAAEQAIRWTKKEARQRGHWIGSPPARLPVDSVAAVQAGYQADEACYLFLESKPTPLFWRHESGVDYQAVLPIVSDGGSIPDIARRIPKEWGDFQPFGAHLYAWVFHDSCYRHGGCFTRQPGGEWAWLPLTRRIADLLLYQMLPSTGGKRLEVRMVYRAVRIGAGRAWTRHRRRESRSVKDELALRQRRHRQRD